MFFETVIPTDDKSYFTDELEKLTGRSRSYWDRFPVHLLAIKLRHELQLKQNHKRGGINHGDT